MAKVDLKRNVTLFLMNSLGLYTGTFKAFQTY